MSHDLYRRICQPATTEQANHIAYHRPPTFIDVTVIHKPGVYGEDEEIIPTKHYAPPEEIETFKKIDGYDEFSLIERRNLVQQNDQHVVRGTEVVVQSRTLCSTLRGIISSTYDNFDIKSTPIIMPAPFYELFFHERDLKSFSEDESIADHLRAEVKLLRDLMQNDKLTIPRRSDYDTMIMNGKIHFETLWTLFPPNKLLIRSDGGAPECLICRNVFRKGLSWKISGVRLDFDGEEMGFTKLDYMITFAERVDQTMDISQLPIVPVDYFPGNWNATRRELVARGKRFMDLMGKSLTGFKYYSYEGPMWETNDHLAKRTRQIKQRVVIDYAAYLRNHSSVDLERDGRMTRRSRRGMAASPDSDIESGSVIVHSDIYNQHRGNSGIGPFEQLLEAALEKYGMKDMEDLLILSPARVPGYGLKEKSWAWLLLDDAVEIEPRMGPFNSLQMDPVIKSLVKSLVDGHESSKDDADGFDDLIRGKGRGLVILLTGPPGVGKTLTAESIAEIKPRPLYNLSARDLGNDPGRVESKLREVFYLAQEWDAVILLDEADVVLAKRTSSDPARNALTSVFLRMLEYYEGMLFLTSNRTENFDEAFLSRIHLTINLPELQGPQRTEVWKNLVKNRAGATNASAWRYEMFRSLGKLVVNGRQIKNLLSTALLHAKSRGEPLAIGHICDIIQVELLSSEKNKSTGKEVVQELRALAAAEGQNESVSDPPVYLDNL